MVWSWALSGINPTHREHTIVGTGQQSVRDEADLGWRRQYLVDADHIGLRNVDLFIESSEFFTLDVADFIGKKADTKSLIFLTELAIDVKADYFHFR